MLACPVCGKDHIHDAGYLIQARRSYFSPCPQCRGSVRNKSAPPDGSLPEACSCGKMFIDDVFALLYYLLVDAGIFTGTEALSSVGIPLIDPGLFLRTPPFLPPRSILLISSVFSEEVADRAYREIPQVSGILADQGKAPGVIDLMDFSDPVPCEHQLLCGCDVRSDLFMTSRGPVAMYKKQGSVHIEFPKPIDPKIRSVEAALLNSRPETFVDACSGCGTLGLAAMRLGIRHTILNDPWYVAAFFSGFNLLVNQDLLGLSDIRLTIDYHGSSVHPVREDSFLIAEGSGPDLMVEVYQGGMAQLPALITGSYVLTAFDPFDKPALQKNHRFFSFWQQTVGGEVFIP